MFFVSINFDTHTHGYDWTTESSERAREQYINGKEINTNASDFMPNAFTIVFVHSIRNRCFSFLRSVVCYCIETDYRDWAKCGNKNNTQNVTKPLPKCIRHKNRMTMPPSVNCNCMFKCRSYIYLQLVKVKVHCVRWKKDEWQKQNRY